MVRVINIELSGLKNLKKIMKGYSMPKKAKKQKKKKQSTSKQKRRYGGY